jgi:hypothetical protein
MIICDIDFSGKRFQNELIIDNKSKFIPGNLGINIIFISFIPEEIQ